MHSAPLFPGRGRALVLLALVVLLHVFALGLLTSRLELPRLLPGQGEAPPLATRLLAEPAPTPPVPVPPPEVAAAPLPPLPDIAPVPLEASSDAPAPAFAPASLDPAFAEVAHAAVAGAAVPDSFSTAPGALPGAAVETIPEATPQAAPAPDAPPAAPALPQYAVDLPGSASVKLDVARTDADGTRWSGEALLAWQLGPDAYKMRFEAGIRIVLARINLVVLTSEGKLDGAGFAPLKMTEKRRGRALTATHFDRSAQRITFSSSTAAYPLAPGAQDKASVPLQLAAIARADARQLESGVEMLVAEEREAVVYRFELVGQETIQTRLGALPTWHLTRPPKPGSYKSRLDIWLAPDQGWLPVQIRNTEANGAVTTQTVNNIAVGQPES